MSWQPRTLAQCAKFQSGGTPSKSNPAYWGGDIPWVGSGEMSQSFIYDTELRLTEDGAENGTRRILENTVLVVVRGMSLAKEFRIAITRRPMTFNQDVKALKCADDIDPQFLFYALKARKDHIRDLATEASHGTKKLETSTLNSVEILVPNTIEEQKAVATIALNYDDLIENNRRRIALLEDAARQLYKEWFVRFRFPGHEHVKVVDGVPEGWECLTLRDVATLHYGKALKEDTRVPGDIPVYGSSGIVGSHNKALVTGPGIILGRTGNVGSVRWSHSDFFPIDTVYFISSEQSNFHLYLALQNMQFMSTDVAVPGLNRDFAYSRSLTRPEAKVAERFEEEVGPIYYQIQKLTDWNSKLAQARDLLLSKLMNGTLTV